MVYILGILLLGSTVNSPSRQPTRDVILTPASESECWNSPSETPVLNRPFSFPGAKPLALFNGRDLANWHMDVPALDKDPNGPKPFVVRHSETAGRNVLVSLGTPGGHLITDQSYENYRLEVVYRFSAKPGNCGVLVHCSNPRRLYGMFPESLEVQMQSGDAGDFWCIGEDITVPDMERRRGPKERWGVDGDKNRRIVNLTDGSEKPLGEWNTMWIECFRDTVKVRVNGELVNFGWNCTARKGQIALQAEGSEVEFKSIELSPIGNTAG